MTENYREASLLLVGVIERQHRALELQALANRELSEGLKEAMGIVSTLLVGDPSVALSLPHADIEDADSVGVDDPADPTPRGTQGRPST